MSIYNNINMYLLKRKIVSTLNHLSLKGHFDSWLVVSLVGVPTQRTYNVQSFI